MAWHGADRLEGHWGREPTAASHQRAGRHTWRETSSSLTLQQGPYYSTGRIKIRGLATPKAALPRARHETLQGPSQSSAARLKLLVPPWPDSFRHLQAKPQQPSALCFCRHLPERKGAGLWLLSFRQHGDGYSARGKAGSAPPSV